MWRHNKETLKGFAMKLSYNKYRRMSLTGRFMHRGHILLYSIPRQSLPCSSLEMLFGWLVVSFLGSRLLLTPQDLEDSEEHAKAVINNSCNVMKFQTVYARRFADCLPYTCVFPLPGRWSTTQTSSPSVIQSWRSATSRSTSPKRSHCHQAHVGAGPETAVRWKKERQRTRTVCKWRL